MKQMKATMNQLHNKTRKSNKNPKLYLGGSLSTKSNLETKDKAYGFAQIPY